MIQTYSSGNTNDLTLSITKTDKLVDALIVQVKNEIAGNMSDPYMLTITYYFDNISDAGMGRHIVSFLALLLQYLALF